MFVSGCVKGFTTGTRNSGPLSHPSSARPGPHITRRRLACGYRHAEALDCHSCRRRQGTGNATEPFQKTGKYGKLAGPPHLSRPGYWRAVRVERLPFGRRHEGTGRMRLDRPSWHSHTAVPQAAHSPVPETKRDIPWFSQSWVFPRIPHIAHGHRQGITFCHEMRKRLPPPSCRT